MLVALYIVNIIIYIVGLYFTFPKKNYRVMVYISIILMLLQAIVAFTSEIPIDSMNLEQYSSHSTAILAIASYCVGLFASGIIAIILVYLSIYLDYKDNKRIYYEILKNNSTIDEIQEDKQPSKELQDKLDELYRK